MYSTPHRCAGWSLIELVVVITILVGLMALGFLTWSMIRHRAAVNATSTLVRGIAAQITTYGHPSWIWQEPLTGQTTGQLFDLNHDGLIDGLPAPVAGPDHDGGFSPALIASGYQGFFAMTGLALSTASHGKNGQPLDAWRHPLRIAFAAGIYGTTTFGIWSAGPDGKDGTADDITSW